MGRKKKSDSNSNESLSEFQDTSKTGRTEGIDVTHENGTATISGTAEAIMGALDKAAEKAKRKGIVITAAELVDQMFCNYKYEHSVGPNTINKVSTKSEVPVHSDLVIAFRSLDAHLALICEEVDKDLIGDINDIDHEPTSEKISQFTVTHFILDGTDEARSVVLKGTKTLTTDEDIKLETPKIILDDSYPFATELSSTIQDCVKEVEEYMKGNKQAENPQPELPFSDGTEEEKLVEEEL
jgi:hypothetical protein